MIWTDDRIYRPLRSLERLLNLECLGDLSRSEYLLCWDVLLETPKMENGLRSEDASELLGHGACRVGRIYVCLNQFGTRFGDQARIF